MDTTTRTTAQQAAQIMGTNFHGPDVWERHFGADGPPQPFWGIVPFSVQTLRKRRETHLLVFLGGLSIIDALGRYPRAFTVNKLPWFLPPTESWARVHLQWGWYLIRKTPVPDSAGKSMEEQLLLLKTKEVVPNATVMTLALLLHHLETGERLFEDRHPRVANVNAEGTRIGVGMMSPGKGYAPVCVGIAVRNNQLHGLASMVEPIR